MILINYQVLSESSWETITRFGLPMLFLNFVSFDVTYEDKNIRSDIN